MAQEGDSRRANRALSHYIILIMVFVALAPMVLTGTISLSLFGGSYKDKVAEHLNELVEKHSQNIDSFLMDRLGDIRVVARSYDYDQLSDPKILGDRLKILREEYGFVYVDLGVVDEQGIQVSYAGPFNLARADYSSSAWFRTASKSEYSISDVFTGLRQTPHFIVAVKRTTGGRNWILRATIDFNAFNTLVENLRVGQTGFAFIVNHEGQFQTNPHAESVKTTDLLKDMFPDPLVDTASRVRVREDSFGQEWLLAGAPLKAVSWVLYCQQKTSEAYAVLQQTRRVGELGIVFGGLITLAVAVFLSQRMVRAVQRAQVEKAAMNEQVIEAGRLASIGELAAGIAHEINNPVAIMVEEAGWIEDLLRDPDPTSEENLTEIKRAVTQIRRQGGRCKEITHKLLSFARKTDPVLTVVDVNQMVLDVASLLKQKTRYANIVLDTALADHLPTVAASPSELQQVLLNLVNNAVDAIGSTGGQVVLRTWREEGDVAIEVADTGQGIPEPILNKVFDPFFTTKPVGQGTGLGLSICYGIVSKLGGRIGVKSRVGEGTIFTVRLPVKTDPGDEPLTDRKTLGEGG